MPPEPASRDTGAPGTTAPGTTAAGSRRGTGAPGAPRVTGIGDEAAPSLTGQIAVARRLGWTALELRTVDGTALADLTEPAVRDIADRLRAAGLGVVCLDSRIGNWARPVTADFSADLAELERLAAYGDLLGCRSVRIMSYPNDGLTDDEWAGRAIDRVRRLARRAEDLGVVLLHENCAGWAGDSASRTLRLLAETGSDALRVLFDTGNGVPYGYDAFAYLRRVLPHVGHVHIKDAVAGDGAGRATYVLPGDGEARVADCLALLAGHGYRGHYSLEPHLAHAPHAGVRADGPGAADLFVRAGRRLAELVERAAPARGAPAPARGAPAPAHAAPAPAHAAPAPAHGAPVPSAQAAPAPVRPRVALRAADHDLLLRLLRTPTAGPLEDPDAPHELRAAQHAYAEAAKRCGMEVVGHTAPPPEAVLRDDVPVRVRAAVTADPAFLDDQPSLLLRLGPELPRERTVMFNVHLDTVAGAQPVSFDGRRFTGRGAVDAKGPAVALLAGVRAAAERCPAVGRDTAVLVQAVAGEEGGALGTFGTRPLVEAGHVGALNVFCEPTGLRHLPRATASATARLTVTGEDAVDDRPGAGHNATVLLGFLAQHLAGALDRRPDVTACVAGLHTGTTHNRVHGTGSLLLNLAYGTPEAAVAAERALTEALADGLRVFTERFAATRQFARTAADAARITRLTWDKRGLPALGPQPDWGHALLAEAGIDAWPATEPAFTCDAIWLHGTPGTFTTVLGPGRLDANHAHADGEFVDLTDLEAFASAVAALLVTFATAPTPRLGDPA